MINMPFKRISCHSGDDKKIKECQGSLKQKKDLESNVLSFEFPYHLKSESNLSEHWSSKAKRHKLERTFLTLALKNKECQIPCVITLTRIAPREFDEDNLLSSFKNIRDIISDFLIPGKARGRADGDPRLSFVYFQEKSKAKVYRVRIEISSCQENPIMTNDKFDSKKIEEIIHHAKKILDVPSEFVNSMSVEDQIKWQKEASDCLTQLTELLKNTNSYSTNKILC